MCNLPIQAPVIVPTYKKLTIEESVTGRMIKYTCGSMETLAASRSSSSFISFLWEGEEKFGKICLNIGHNNLSVLHVLTAF